MKTLPPVFPKASVRGSAGQGPWQYGLLVCLVAGGVVLLGSSTAWPQGIDVPGIQLDFSGPEGARQISSTLKIVFILTVLSLAPAILILMTSFTRLVIVFSFLRHALGTQASPPNQVIIGLALFLTFFIMQPVWQEVYQSAIVPYEDRQISEQEFFQRAAGPLKEFMLKQTRKKDLALFVELSHTEKPQNADALAITTVIPAFVVSELKTAFQIGFMLYLPFLILDMVVSSILLSMGMMMLPPVMISLPFKLMLFVLVDGWNMLIGSLVKSFQ
ncbi:flagellar type III secretion system pore protein FliP [Desulfoferrobacter suflitae]|uniref:flagellar type III secretion system pore protein FliP n=1 Tax=Desulfoferrobacter suflitae TaxID=2865782 RepID=UPI0021649982|nr:flagellar type III secretion system pore protein FliP [Desulfoferrobacter suflitae]MCK8602428.1 flagellar type III secretion system pore protein FliP [Desulfoferrobacter suflitae]